jgi:replication factor C subunit 1
MNSLWVDQHRPSTLSEVIGGKESIAPLWEWLTNYVTGKKAALLSGPPGIGKTTIAGLLAKTKGFTLMEWNASDIRNKSLIQEVVVPATTSTTIEKKPRLIVMDEVDGLDHGGMPELIQCIKLTKTPILCICNDRHSPHMQSLVNVCLDVRMKRPNRPQIVKRVMEIAQMHGLFINKQTVDTMVEHSGNDIRHVLNTLQMQHHTAGAKDESLRYNSFDACGIILGKTPFAQKYDAFFIDSSIISLFVQQNYINNRMSIDQMASAADAISDVDVLTTMTNLPIQAAMVARVGCINRPETDPRVQKNPFIVFPKWLGMYSRTEKRRREIGNINTSIQQGRLEVIPYMRFCLLDMLRKKNIDAIISTLNAYGLHKDDFMESMKSCQFIIERDRDSEFQDAYAHIDSKTKSAFTRKYK